MNIKVQAHRQSPENRTKCGNFLCLLFSFLFFPSILIFLLHRIGYDFSSKVLFVLLNIKRVLWSKKMLPRLCIIPVVTYIAINHISPKSCSKFGGSPELNIARKITQDIAFRSFVDPLLMKAPKSNFIVRKD